MAEPPPCANIGEAFNDNDNHVNSQQLSGYTHRFMISFISVPREEVNPLGSVYIIHERDILV
jgi:hypothetical protein